MKKYMRQISLAVLAFILVAVLNFFLPRALPGNPVAYLTGFAEEEMTPAQVEYYSEALHLNDSMFTQFRFYTASLLDGTLGYSYKKQAVVSALIFDRLVATLQITLPAVVLSTVFGLFWGISSGYNREKAGDRFSTSFLIVLNTVPTFLIGLLLLILCCFKHKWLPYSGLSSGGIPEGTAEFAIDRIKHLILPVGTLTLASFPSRYLLMRNTAAGLMDEKYVLYAQERGLTGAKIRRSYLLRNIAQPFITMVGMSVSVCVGGSLVIENLFSINGMGRLLTDAVYSLDYPLMQGILFVTTAIMAVSIIVTDLICIWIDPRVRRGEGSV